MSEQLVKAAQGGSDEALVLLLEPLEKKLYCTALSMVGSCQDAEDVWQNTALKCWQQIRGLKNPGLFRIWITRILINEANTLLRKRARQPVLQKELPETNAPEQDVEKYLAVYQYLEDLPSAQREAVVLRFWMDLSLDEIALALDVPLSTAKTRLYQGIKSLGVALREEGVANE